MFHPRIPNVLRCVAAAAMLCIAASACDASTSDDDVARSLPCNLADEDCAALPVAADAFALLESMDVDLDEADVQLVEDPYEFAGADQADAPSRPNALTPEAPPPEAQKFSCSGNPSVTCCCFWDGDYWGCGCF